MSASTSFLHRFAVSITAHAWNADRTKVAICPNNNKIYIYAKQGNEWVKEASLKEHDAVVTSIDWAGRTNRILSCSQDRNAYVWAWKENPTTKKPEWTPTLVILRINRAATRCKWSPNEDKFAVSSGACVVSICYFEQDNDWWVSKHIKKHTSTVLDVAWHPNNVLLATASSDGQLAVVSAFVKGVDTKESVGAGTAFGSKLPFGTICKEIPVGAWVHCVKWSASGNRLAFATHDSTLHILECPTPDHKLTSLKYNFLPLMDILFINENNIVGVGHDYNPLLFQFAGGWKFSTKLDAKGGAAKKAGGPSAAQMFKDMTAKGTSDSSSDTQIETKHLNCITTIQVFAGTADNVKQFSTSGLDGQVAVWDLKI